MKAALLLLAPLWCAAVDDPLGAVLEPANRLAARTAAPRAETPVYVAARTAFWASERLSARWAGPGTTIALPETPALARGIKVRVFEDGRMRDLANDGMLFFVERNVLVLQHDAGVQRGDTMTVFFDSAAKADAAAHLHPGLRTLQAKLFLEATRADKDTAAACRIVGDGARRQLQAASTSAVYEVFPGAEENLEALLALLDGFSGCAGRGFPEGGP